MLATLATAALALGPVESAARPDRPPAITVRVFPGRGVSSHLVTRTLDEAAAVWNDAGISLAWRVVPNTPPPELSPTPHVVIADDTGRRREGADLPLGWVHFHRPEEPDGRIHLSHANGLSLLRLTSGLGRSMGRMLLPAQVDLLLGRMLGRALAHELGHYLLKSAVHTREGLMRSRRTVQEFIGHERRGFDVNVHQRSTVVAGIMELKIED
jgi:hypothetical protein